MRKIIPAVLEKNVEIANERIKQFEKLSKIIQIDIADGRFVKNKTFSANDIKKIKSKSSLEFHLMVENPEKYIVTIKKSSLIVVHCEIKDFVKYIDKIKNKKIDAGAAINPNTNIKKLIPAIKKIKKVIVLCVIPGWQGAKFMPSALKKIKQIKKLNKKIIIQVDGGINEKTIKLAEKAGADEFIVGSALIKAKDIKKEFNLLSKGGKNG